MSYELPVNVGVSQKAVLINDKGKVLVLLRGKTAPAAPLTWDLPGGDVDWGEDAQESIEREVKEEAGFSVGSLRIFDVHTRVNEDGYHWFTLGYVAEVGSPEVTISWEHDEFRWVDKAEFKKLKSAPKIQQFVEKAFESRA